MKTKYKDPLRMKPIKHKPEKSITKTLVEGVIGLALVGAIVETIKK